MYKECRGEIGVGRGEELYRRFSAGDEAAFEEILLLYREGLILFIDHFVRDIHTAEDISVDCFVYLLLHPQHYNFTTSLKTYLYMLGRSRALNCLRHRRVLSVLPPDENATDEQTPEALFLRDEQKRAVHAAIGALPSDMQTAVYLVYFEELSYAEAAYVMKKRVKQVDNLLYRAKKLLKTALGGAV